MAAGNLQSEVQKILDGLGRMPSIVGELGNVVARLAAAISPLQNAISRLFGGSNDTAQKTVEVAQQSLLASAVNRNSVATDANTAAVTRLSTLIGNLNAMISGLIARMNASLQRQGYEQLTGGKNPLMLAGGSLPGGSDGGGVGGAAAGGMSALGKLGAVAAVAAAAIGVMVVGINLAEREFQKLQGFVKLFNPGVIQQFQFALDNLGATIGRAFVPMFQAATGVVREWTAALAPVIQQLTPIIQQFSTAFANMLVPMLQQFASVIRAMLPGFRLLGEVLQASVQWFALMFQAATPFIRGVMLLGRFMYELSGMGVIVRVLTKAMEAFSKVFEIVDAAFSIMETVITSIVDSMSTFIETLVPFKGIMDALGRAVQTVIRSMYVLAIMMAKFLGLDSVVGALLDTVAGKTMRGDTAAQSPQLKTLEQLSKDLALAATAAGGAGGLGSVRNEQEFWRQTLAEMRKAEANGISVKDLLAAILGELRRMVPGGGGGGAGAPAAPPPGPAAPGAAGLNPLDIFKGMVNPFWGGQALGKGLGFN